MEVESQVLAAQVCVGEASIPYIIKYGVTDRCGRSIAGHHRVASPANIHQYKRRFSSLKSGPEGSPLWLSDVLDERVEPVEALWHCRVYHGLLKILKST